MNPRMRTVLIALGILVLSAVQMPVSSGQQEFAPPAAPANADPRVVLTETVGVLSGLYLYQTYLNIDLLADAKADKRYDDEAARTVLGTVIGPLEVVDKQFSRVGTLAQTEADRDAAGKLRKIAGLLRRQGQELSRFWDTGRPADAARYEATRQEAWRELGAVLGSNRKP
jgi:hypothetical protein